MTTEDFSRLWTNLVDRVHKAGRTPLSDQERHFYAVNLFRGSVPRSGMAGYFENHKCSEITDARKGLREMNLDAVLAIFDDALAVILGDTVLPDDSTLLEIYPEGLSEEEHEAASDRLEEALASIEEKFFDHEDELWDALVAYAEKHQLEPRGGDAG